MQTFVIASNYRNNDIKENQVFIVYKTDAQHSYASRDVIGIATSIYNACDIVALHDKKHGCYLKKDDLYMLENILQTQNYKGEGEFHIEKMQVNKLL